MNGTAAAQNMLLAAESIGWGSCLMYRFLSGICQLSNHLN
ncbi:MAG: nitroreductase family protein [Spirochaetaceae bacterium]|nr:nitroreductase family protein [Spirochaetaceae bacterium]